MRSSKTCIFDSRFDECLVNFGIYVLYQILVGIKLDLVVIQIFDGIDNGFILRRNNLSTIFPIYFVAIIFRWIVRCRKYNSALAAQIFQGKRQFWSGSQIRKQIHLNAISRENISNQFSQGFTIMTTVKSDNGFQGLVWKGNFQIIRKSLRTFSKRVFVDAVVSNAHNTAHATRSKFEIFIKTFFQIFWRRSHHCFDSLLCCSVKCWCKPFVYCV